MPVTVNEPGRSPDALWRAYLDWLAEHLPEATPRLNPPADESAIAELEALVGHELPDAVKAGWRQHDGERCDSYRGVALGFWWLPVAEVAQVWNDWAQIRREQDEAFFEVVDKPQRSYPERAIKKQYTSPGWIPILRWPYDGDYVGLDYDPGPEGRPGQVINFGRDQEHKFVAAEDFATFLAWMVQEAEGGCVTIDRDDEDDDPIFEHEDGILVNALSSASGATFR